MTEPKSITVDFDQTICDSKFPELGPPKLGAKEALQAFRDMGYQIIISSCRSCGWHWDVYYPDTEFTHATNRPVFIGMQEWLDEHQMPYDILDDGTRGKTSSSFYIDDKGLRFEDNWSEIVEFVRNRQ